MSDCVKSRLNRKDINMELLKKIYKYFTSSETEVEEIAPDTMSMNEILKVLVEFNPEINDEPVEEIVQTIPEHMCYEDSGKVTYVSEHYGLIEKTLYFEHDKMSTIKVGMTLQYLAFKQDDEVKISKILNIKQDDWDEEIMTIPRPIAEKIEIGQVTERKNRIIYVSTDKGVVHVDLNKTESAFIPVVGDWLSMGSVVETDENSRDLIGRILEVTKISPLRFKITEGYVKIYDRENNFGQVDDNILFYKDALSPGYVPLINDKVTVEIIESEIERYQWRALKVLPSNAILPVPYIAKSMKEDKELLKDKNGILILPLHLGVSVQEIGHRQIVNFEIHNTSTEEHRIVNIYIKFNSNEQQLYLDREFNSVVIKSQQVKLFAITCEAKFLGTTRELVVVDFEGFSIGRWVKIEVFRYFKPPAKRNTYQKNGRYLAAAAMKSYQASNQEVIIGQRPVKPPSFITNKLPVYDIPDPFAKRVFGLMTQNAYMTDIPIKDISPCLGNPLDMSNYTEVFHNLLYLEEIALQVNIRRYDIPLAKFIKDGEFLMLEVPDLSERRPSIIIGDKVMARNPIDENAKALEGHVHKTGKAHVYLKFNANFHNIYNDEDYRIEFHCSRTNFRRYHQAIDLARNHLGKSMLFPSIVKEKDPQTVFIEEVEPEKTPEGLKESKYGRIARKSLKKRLPDETSPKQTEDKPETPPKQTEDKPETPPKQNVPKTALKLEYFDKKLNVFQKAAVKNILLGVARPLPYFIFGPPGTGKTVTLIETILQLIRMIPYSRLLVCAPSNSAADLIALRLIDSGVLQSGDLVRMVAYRCISENTIPPKLVPYCVTGDLAREGSRENRNANVNGVQVNLAASVLGRHRVTVGTCMVVGSLYSMGFRRGHFTHIIVDEAGQATEPEIMIPLSLLDTKTAQTVLAGDPMQLGPCVFSLIGKEYGLGDSYFERLICRFPYDRDAIGFPESGGYDPRLVTRLVFNYRSLPELLTCPNDLFYQNELRATVSAEDSPEADLLRRLSPILPKREGRLPPAFVFHGVRGQNFQTPDCPSWFNPVEAGQVFYYLNDLYKLGVKPEDIGIITPYIRQGQHVRELLIEKNLDLPKIGSVEEFQGQEFKVVILSCVRSNETAAQNDCKFGLGFIASPRRLNVAISRAQALLIIVGNPHLLISDKYWRAVLMYAIDIGGYTGCNCPQALGNKK